jgi:hypothetical protein
MTGTACREQQPAVAPEPPRALEASAMRSSLAPKKLGSWGRDPLSWGRIRAAEERPYPVH